jgi:hypothetical protein
MVLAVIVAGGLAMKNPGAVWAFYDDIYPSDPAKRQALDLCFVENHQFNRLDASERNACYQHMLLRLGDLTPSGSPIGQPAVNFVDLQRAAGEGSLPRNDIRRLEQTRQAQRAINSPH